MASISKYISKDGTVSYRIRVYIQGSVGGRKRCAETTFRPKKGISAKQEAKAVEKAAFEFEQKVKTGFAQTSDVTLDQFMEIWFRDYAEKQLKPHTVTDYRQLSCRISAALGHLKIQAIKPNHLMQFYDQLNQPGVRMDGKYKAGPALLKAFPKGARKELVKAAGVSERTMSRIWKGEMTSLATAEKISQAAHMKLSKAFINESAEKTLTGDSVRLYHRLLSSMFSTAIRWQILNDNPCGRVTAPKIGDREISYMDEKEIAAMLAALEDAPIQYSVLVQLALFTGGRRGELCALRWSDIDMSAGLMSINRTLSYVTGQGLIFSDPKTHKSKRAIKLSSTAITLLKDYQLWQNTERVKIGSKWAQSVEIMGHKVKNDLLFTKWNGEPIDPNKVTSWFSQFLRKHNLPDVSFHSLRHSNAALLIAAHVPVTTVAGRLGHAKTSTTTDIYAGFVRTSDAKAADALEDVLGGIFRASDDLKFATR